jgi:GNAT superfamily N-acetyltransferase
MTDAAIRLSGEVQPEDRATVLAGLVAYNAQHGYPWPWQDLAFVVRDSAGRAVGGVLAETNARWCFIKGLWVAKEIRGQGHGSRLLVAAEAAAQERGCIGVYLDTYSFQARPFYERHGYTVFGVLPDLPPGGAKYYLAKRLDASLASASYER